MKDLVGGDALQRVCNLYGRNGRRRVEKEMHMIGLHLERAYGPGVCFTDAAGFYEALVGAALPLLER